MSRSSSGPLQTAFSEVLQFDNKIKNKCLKTENNILVKDGRHVQIEN